MVRKSILFLLIFIVICSSYGVSKTNNTKTWKKHQEKIDKAKRLNEKFRFLAAAFLEEMETQVKDVVINNKWESLGLEEKKIIFTVAYSRTSEFGEILLNKELFPLEIKLCERVSRSLKAAITKHSFLKQYLVVLYIDIEKLKKENVKSGDKWIRKEHKKKPGSFKDKNSFFEILLDIDKSKGIINIGGKMVSLRTRDEFLTTESYDILAPDLIREYARAQAPLKVTPEQLKPSYVKEIKKLGEIITYYQPPGDNSKINKLSPGGRVHSGGIIWFEITLPEPGGYLLAYSEDSTGKTFNLFPGTRNAVINGDYRVPYNLDNPYTEIQKTTAQNAIAAKLPLNKVMIGGYTFDDTPGDEIFYFYYTNERNSDLERIMINSRNTLKDIPQMKGVLNKATEFDPNQLDVKMNRKVFYHKELKKYFKSE